MKKSQIKHQAYSDINITPMLDLAYVLLVTVIILTTASVQGIRVHMPKTATTSPLASHQTRAIAVTQSGQIYLDANPVTLDELSRQLALTKTFAKDLPIVFKGDEQSPYSTVMDVMEILKHLGVTQIGLATQRRK